MNRKSATWIVSGALITVCGGVAINQVIDARDRLQWMWLATAVIVTTAGGWLALRLNGPAADTAVQDAGMVEHTLTALAGRVETAWKPEQSRRRLLNPRPLPTAWTTIGPPVADHWANVRTDCNNEPLDLGGVVDLAHPDAFQRIVTDARLRGRVVLLGDPGAGKTSLLIRLTVTLLADRSHRTHHDHAAPLPPVPVLLRLSTWNPDEQTLHQWIGTRLAADYGQRHPIATARLMPLLDGLDEMPEHRRKQALLAISNTFIDTPLVLTSRTTEYLDTLSALAGNVLAAAAVLELTTLQPETVREYLELTTSRPIDWANVFTRDATNQGGRLAASLSAPLWVDLARTTYTDPYQSDNDPSELLLLPDTDAVHAQLLDRLIPTAYLKPNEPGPDGHTWRRDHADRWLRHLAMDMRRRGTQDIAWWDLALAVPRALRLICGLVAGLSVGLIPGLALLMVGAGAEGAIFGIVLGLAVGLPVGLNIGLRKPPPPSQGKVQLLLRPGRRARRQVFGAGLVGGLITGLIGALMSGIVVGLAIGIVFGLLAEFTTFFSQGDADVPAASDPLGLIRGDRRRAIIMTIGFGLVIGLGAGLTFGLASGSTNAIVVGLVVGLVGGLPIGLVASLSYGAWGRLGLARLWWCGHGWLPWRMMAFLSDAHRRGVLRQAGGVWQFRHGLLRDRLAEHGPGVATE